MRNLKEVADLSGSATSSNKVVVYYNYATDEVLTAEMIQKRHCRHALMCTELIRPNTEREIAVAVLRALLM